MTTLTRLLSALILVGAVLAPTADANDANPRAILRTEMGEITLELYPESAPRAYENFTTHARNGYYDGMTVHRVQKDFLIQMGDPDGTGYGGKSIWGGSFENEIDPTRSFDAPYVLGMANRGTHDTNTSQFFITVAPTPWMNGNFTIFGRVLAGEDVVERISEVDVEITQSKPIRDLIVHTVEILEAGANE